MQWRLRILWSTLSTVAAFAQGQVNFNNYVPAALPPVKAPATLFGSGNKAGAGSMPGLKAQLYLIRSGLAVPVGPTTTFRESPPAAQYYLNGITVVVPGIDTGQQATLLMRVFEGASYEEAQLRQVYHGESAPVTITLGGGTSVPADLIGLEPMLVGAWPEPSTIALFLLGGGLFLLVRHRDRPAMDK